MSGVMSMTAAVAATGARVSAVETALLSVPYATPLKTAIHHITTMDVVWTWLRTDAGLVGQSYVWVFGRARARALRALIEEDLGPQVIGSDPAYVEQTWQRLWRDLNFIGHAGLPLFALSALDMALWDLRGRAAGLPLAHLLGACRDRLPVYASDLYPAEPLADIEAKAAAYARQGFRALKMRVAGTDAGALAERITAVQRAFGGPLSSVMIDAVQGWSALTAVAVGRRLEPLGLGWIEDPVSYDDIEGLAEVTAALDTPVAAGENAFAPLEVRRLVERRAADVLIVDPQRIGGVTGARKAMVLAEAWHRPVAFHVFPEVCAHLLAACPTGTYLEYAPLWTELLEDLWPDEDGCVGLPEGSGIPLPVKEDAFERFRIG